MLLLARDPEHPMQFLQKQLGPRGLTYSGLLPIISPPLASTLQAGGWPFPSRRFTSLGLQGR